MFKFPRRGFSKHRNNDSATHEARLGEDRSMDDSVASPNTTSSLVPNIAPSRDAGPLNLSVTSTSRDCPSPINTVYDIVTLSGYDGPIGEDDIVIAVMGVTGAGKSTFVSKATGGDVDDAISSNLKSQTQTVRSIRCSHPDGRRNIVLVDTPGFDDTYLSDSQILAIIANWLKNTYQNNIKLSGVLYLHRISDVRFAGTPLRNLHVFRELCGQENLKNVVLVTTMWDEIDDLVGSKREEDLLSNFWKGMMGLGSRTCRFQGTYDSAWEILNCLDLERDRQKRTPLQIQRELVDQNLPLHETSAAKTLLRYLVQLIKDFQKVWGKLRNKTRPTAIQRGPTGSHQRRDTLSRSSTNTSIGTSLSQARLSDTSSVSTSNSRCSLSPTETVSSCCSTTNRRDMLVAAITGLRIAYQVAEMAPIPILKGTIGTVLHIAQSIEGMGGTHHAISQVVENSGWLLEEITQHAAETPLSGEGDTAFLPKLRNLEKVVKKIQERGPVARFLLHDADIRAISACTASIKTTYDKLEVKLAMDNRQAIARLEVQIIALRNNPLLRKCECRLSVVHEERQEDEQQSTNTCQSS